jgi:hypothetical protein
LEELYEKGLIRTFYYHHAVPIKITKNNTYTHDFVVFYKSRIEIVEVKGYNPYSKMRDDMIHQVMLAKSEQELRDWLLENDYSLTNVKTVKYRKIKFLKAYGFVDWDFKNPNTLANKRKEKITDLEAELKEYKNKVKDYERFMKYLYKPNKKLTKEQLHWKQNFEAVWRLKNGC